MKLTIGLMLAAAACGAPAVEGDGNCSVTLSGSLGGKMGCFAQASSDGNVVVSFDRGDLDIESAIHTPEMPAAGVYTNTGSRGYCTIADGANWTARSAAGGLPAIGTYSLALSSVAFKETNPDGTPASPFLIVHGTLDCTAVGLIELGGGPGTVQLHATF